MQPVSNFMADKRCRCRQPLQTLLAFFLASMYHDQHSRGAAVAGEFYRSHAGKANSGISQLAFDNGFNFFFQGLAQALPMIFLSAPLH